MINHRPLSSASNYRGGPFIACVGKAPYFTDPGHRPALLYGHPIIDS